MKKQHLVAVLGAILTLGLLGACSDDDPTRPSEDSDVLLTVQFENYLLFGQPREGYVFASGEDGRVLDCAPWTSTSKVVLRNTEVHPDTISLTIFENSDTSPRFTTELAVPAGSVRTFPSMPYPTQTGVASIHLRNTPATQRFIFSANFRTFLGQVQPPPTINLDVMGDTTDLYAMVVPESGAPIGGWLRGLRAGNRDTVDFGSEEDVAPLDSVKFSIPSGADWTFCNARAQAANGLSSGLKWLDHVSMFGSDSESMTLYLPNLDHSDVVLEFYQEFEGETGTFYWQEIEGHLPDAITNLEGDLDVVAALPGSVVITASFPWDRFYSSWSQDKGFRVSWSIMGPASTEGSGLPHIPPEVSEVIPDFPREDFTMSVVEVYQNTSEGIVRSQGKKFPFDTRNREKEPMRPGLQWK